MAEPDEDSDAALVATADAALVATAAAPDPGLVATTDAALVATAASQSAIVPSAGLDGSMPRGAKLGRYMILAVLGRGGMGVVYAAYDPELDRKVALKLLRQELAGGSQGAQRLLREGRAIAKLAHPNVVAVFDVGTHEGAVFVAMELVDGRSLDTWIDEDKTRSWRAILDVFVQAGDGLVAAHAAGMVHRDFKPANVLLGKDGRVRVTDFGLARLRDGESAGVRADVPEKAEAVDGGLTGTGAIVGTPAYMAPEQFEGAEVDARTDQFSFAVSLYEALYGERPFAGSSMGEIFANIEAGNVRAARPGSKVPARLRAIVLRGLRAVPGERYATLDAMLAELRALARQRRLAWVAGGAAAVALVGGTLLTSRLVRGTADEAACTGAEPQIAEVWNPQVQARIQQAFLATGKPYAATAWQNVKGALDRFSTGWVAMHVDACKASSVRHEQSPEVLDLRMQCLDSRRAELRGIVGVLSAADAGVVENANVITDRMASVAGCADLVALRSPVPLPASPSVRAQAVQAHEQLARALALSESGKFRDGLAIVPGVIATVRGIRAGAIEAEALLTLSDLQAEAGDDKASVESLRASVVASEGAGAWLAAAQGWSGLVVRLGVGLNNYTDALQAGEHARAILDRVAPDGLDAAHLEHALGVVLYEKGDRKPSREALTKAIAIYERELPPGDTRLARAYNDLGNLEWIESNLDKAQQIFERVRTNVERSMGPSHPMVARALGNLSNVLADKGNYPEAMKALEQAIAIDTAGYGADHPELANSYLSMGNLTADAGHDDDAYTWYRRALAIAEKAYGPDHRVTSTILVDMSIIERHRNELKTARTHLEQALRADEKRTGPDHPEVATTLANLVSLSIDEGKLAEAEQLEQRVIAIRLKAFGPDSPDVARAYTQMANIATYGKKYAESIAWALKSLAIDEKRLGKDNPSLATALYNLAAAHKSIGKLADAQTDLARGLAILEAKVPDDPKVADFLTMQSAILLVQHRVVDAGPLIERALAIRDRTQVEAARKARTQDIAARVLWSRDRDRAAKLAQAAVAAYGAGDPQRAELVKWMKANGLKAAR